jgi:cellobiose PTS system EIIB component
MNILLICGSGASSGFMASSMRKAAKKRGVVGTIEARSDFELDNYLDHIDVLLVGPHLKYMEGDLNKKAQPFGVPVVIIDQMTYGSLNGDKALNLALKAIESK